MHWRELPAIASWRHHDARTGFEVCSFAPERDGYRLRGTSTCWEERPWSIGYDVLVDATWATREATLRLLDEAGERQVAIGTREGRWIANGVFQPELTGCLDIDLAASVVTNLLPVRRLGAASEVGPIAVSAAYVDVDLRLRRDEQVYELPGTEHGGDGVRVAYAAPAFDFTADLDVDAAGLIREYPGLASRMS